MPNIIRPAIPAVPPSDSPGLYSFLTSLKQNVELISGTINSSGTTAPIAASTTGSSGSSSGSSTGGTTSGGTGTSTGLSIVLSNPTIVLSQTSGGTIASFANANGTAKMYSGSTDVTLSTTFSAVASSCTGTINTAANVPVTGEGLGYYQVTAITGSAGTLTITGVYDGATISMVVSIVALSAGYPIVSTLPGTGSAGDIVYLTTDNELWRYDGTQWLPLIVAANVAGQIAASQIQDGVITAAKLLPGLQPIQLVTTLPTPGDVGRIVYLETGSTPQLYYDTGSAWSTQIFSGGQINSGTLPAAALVANSITAGQIQAGAITTSAMIANSISGTVIAAGTLNASAIVASSITASQIAAGTITGTQIAANTIAGNQIMAGSITAAELGVNSVTAGAIAAGAVTAAAIAVTSLSAISANMGTLTSGTIIFNNGTYMRVLGIGFGVSSALLDWFGPTQASISTCSKTNAIFYLGVDGSAYFGGQLQPVITRQYTYTGAAVVEIVPYGVTSCTMVVYGGGGGGASSNSTARPTGGGGGGAFAQKTIAVTAGQSITYNIGQGGIGGTYLSGTTVYAGSAGATTTVTGTVAGGSISISAGGGGGGGSGSGGAGGTATGGDVNGSGSAGTSGTPGAGGAAGTGGGFTWGGGGQGDVTGSSGRSGGAGSVYFSYN